MRMVSLSLSNVEVADTPYIHTHNMCIYIHTYILTYLLTLHTLHYITLRYVTLR